MTTNKEKKLLKILKTYEGKTVEDFRKSNFFDLIQIDVLEVNGQAIDEEYLDLERVLNASDLRVIDHIQVRNVMGYIICDVATVEA